MATMMVLGQGANVGLGARTGVVIEEAAHRALIKEGVHGEVDGKITEALLRGKVIGSIESIR